MGRKSLADERREEILAAFERCIGRYGLDVSLEQIADEAGLQRPLIRHYIGNRDELVDQLIERIADAYPARVAELFRCGCDRGIDCVLDALFPTAPPDPLQGVLQTADWDTVLDAVMSTARGRYPRAKERVARMMVEIVDAAADVLTLLYPGAGREACYRAAYAVLCMVQTHESLLLLGLDPRHSAMARASAARLLAELAE
jgi:AcrR family transcriptional regulator